MIKEKVKITKYNRKKTRTQILMEYMRTVAISFFVALLITMYLVVQAQKDMIKNLYVTQQDRLQIEEQIARQLIVESDLMKDLRNKNYAICMRVGHLYEVVHDYENAQFAYKLAKEKAHVGVIKPDAKLVDVLIAQEKFEEANELLDSIRDTNNKDLIKTKTRAYINMGDKYYSIGKFYSAVKAYEKAKVYYDKFIKKDNVVEKSIETRIINAYVETADVMVKRGQNSDAIKFLKKAESYAPDNFSIKYKLAIIYSDSEPIESLKYFENLINKEPQNIDITIYGKALMKAANIEDLKGNHVRAKYYRYKIRSVDKFIERKVVYKNDVDIILDSFIIKKSWFKYKLKQNYIVVNNSSVDYDKLSAIFVLKNGDKEVERVEKNIANKNQILYSNGGESKLTDIVFGKRIFTKRELKNYSIDIYLYKDEKYKTYITTVKVPVKSLTNLFHPQL